MFSDCIILIDYGIIIVEGIVNEFKYCVGDIFCEIVFCDLKDLDVIVVVFGLLLFEYYRVMLMFDLDCIMMLVFDGICMFVEVVCWIDEVRIELVDIVLC